MCLNIIVKVIENIDFLASMYCSEIISYRSYGQQAFIFDSWCTMHYVKVEAGTKDVSSSF